MKPTSSRLKQLLKMLLPNIPRKNVIRMAISKKVILIHSLKRELKVLKKGLRGMGKEL